MYNSEEIWNRVTLIRLTNLFYRVYSPDLDFLEPVYLLVYLTYSVVFVLELLVPDVLWLMLRPPQHSLKFLLLRSSVVLLDFLVSSLALFKQERQATSLACELIYLTNLHHRFIISNINSHMYIIYKFK
jgi:hypothetical protein